MTHLPSELCQVINDDRELEMLRHRINWIHDYLTGNCSRPGWMTPDSMENLQQTYEDRTGHRWDPINGRNVEAVIVYIEQPMSVTERTIRIMKALEPYTDDLTTAEIVTICEHTNKDALYHWIYRNLPISPEGAQRIATTIAAIGGLN